MLINELAIAHQCLVDRAAVKALGIIYDPKAREHVMRRLASVQAVDASPDVFDVLFTDGGEASTVDNIMVSVRSVLVQEYLRLGVALFGTTHGRDDLVERIIISLVATISEVDDAIELETMSPYKTVVHEYSTEIVVNPHVDPAAWTLLLLQSITMDDALRGANAMVTMSEVDFICALQTAF